MCSRYWSICHAAHQCTMPEYIVPKYRNERNIFDLYENQQQRFQRFIEFGFNLINKNIFFLLKKYFFVHIYATIYRKHNTYTHKQILNVEQESVKFSISLSVFCTIKLISSKILYRNNALDAVRVFVCV